MAGLPTPILVLSATGDLRRLRRRGRGPARRGRRGAAQARALGRRGRAPAALPGAAAQRGHGRRPPARPPPAAGPPTRTARPPVAIAASTGGPAALAEILPSLGGLAVPVLVVQHLHPQLVDGFVGWMQRVSALPVVVAADGDRPQPGIVYIAPAGAHLKLVPPPACPGSRWGRPGPSRPAAAAWSSTPTRRACTGRRPTSCSARSPPPRAGRRSACCSPAWATTARPGCWPCAARGP